MPLKFIKENKDKAISAQILIILIIIVSWTHHGHKKTAMSLQYYPLISWSFRICSLPENQEKPLESTLMRSMMPTHEDNKPITEKSSDKL